MEPAARKLVSGPLSRCQPSGAQDLTQGRRQNNKQPHTDHTIGSLVNISSAKALCKPLQDPWFPLLINTEVNTWILFFNDTINYKEERKPCIMELLLEYSVVPYLQYQHSLISPKLPFLKWPMHFNNKKNKLHLIILKKDLFTAVRNDTNSWSFWWHVHLINKRHK